MTGYNRYTGDQKHGNRYCHSCGDQTPIGFQHFHAEDLLKANDTLRDQLRTATAERDAAETECRAHRVQLERSGQDMSDLVTRLAHLQAALAKVRAECGRFNGSPSYGSTAFKDNVLRHVEEALAATGGKENE